MYETQEEDRGGVQRAAQEDWSGRRVFARQVAAQIKAKAELGDLAKEVQIVSAVYNFDTGKVEWGKD